MVASWSVSSVRRANASAEAFGGHDGAFREIVAVAREHIDAAGALFRGAGVNQADDSSMGLATKDSQLAEILVQRDDHAPFASCLLENRLITWIRRLVRHGGDVVSRGFDDGMHSAMDTAVQQNTHQAVVSSIRSWPTIRRAYSRHARTSSRSSQS